MPSGKLGAASLAADVDTLLYTVPVGVTASANVRFANRSTSTIKVRLAVGAGAAPADTDYLSYDLPIPANGIAEDTGLALSPGEKVWARSNSAATTVRIHGFEEQ